MLVFLWWGSYNKKVIEQLTLHEVKDFIGAE